MKKQMKAPIVLASTDKPQKNIYITVKEDTIKLTSPDNKEFVKKYYYVDSPNFVVVIVKKGNQLLLTNQYRYPVNSFCNEFVCGLIDDNESSKTAALRELKEEAGIVATEAKYLGQIFPLSGQNNCCGFVYYVDEFEEIENGKELEEFEQFCQLTTGWYDIEKLKEMIKTNKLNNGITVAAFGMFLLNI